MKLLLAPVLLALVPFPVEGTFSCSFSRSFGSGSALHTAGVESFHAARDGTTSCLLTCDSGAATTLLLKFDSQPNVFNHDARLFDATGCSGSLSVSSSDNEYRLGYEINSATYTNMVLTCTCSSVGQGEPAGPGICFSETTTVMTRERGSVPLKELQVGTNVLVGHSRTKQPIYEPVYSFGHIHETKETAFMKLYTNLTSDFPLEISESHMIYKLDAGQPRVVRADAIKVFDVLLHKAAPAEVNRIERIVKQGQYMPLTPSGSIVVDGLTASTYVSIQEWAPSAVQTLSFFGFSEQRVFHWWLAPYRFFCMGLSKKFCERHNDEGILLYLIWGKQLAELAEGYGVVARVLLFGPPLFIFFGLFNLLEYPLGPTIAPFLLAMFLGLFWFLTTIRSKKEQPVKKTV